MTYAALYHAERVAVLSAAVYLSVSVSCRAGGVLPGCWSGVLVSRLWWRKGGGGGREGTYML